MWLFVVLLISYFMTLPKGQQTLLFEDTLSNSINFAYSGSVTFISDAQRLGDGHCARIPANDTASYFQTISGAISTAKSRYGVVDMIMQDVLKMLILLNFTRKC